MIAINWQWCDIRSKYSFCVHVHHAHVNNHKESGFAVYLYCISSRLLVYFSPKAKGKEPSFIDQVNEVVGQDDILRGPNPK